MNKKERQGRIQLKISMIAKFLMVLSMELLAGPAIAGRIWNYTYDQYGHVLTSDGPRTDINDTTVYGYDGQGNLDTITNALGHVIRLTNYNGRNQPGKIIDANGVETELSYHARGWLLAVTRKNPDGNGSGDAVTRFSYDNSGQITAIALPDASVIRYEYDAAHRLVAISN